VRCLEATDKSTLLQPSYNSVVDQLFDFDVFQFGIARLEQALRVAQAFDGWNEFFIEPGYEILITFFRGDRVTNP